MEPFGLATSVVSLVGFALQLVVGALGMIDKTVSAHNEISDELKKLKKDLQHIQTQMVRIHRTLKVWASDTKDRGFKMLLREEDSQAAVAELCTALEETSNVFGRLTDETKAKESKLRSLPLPDDIRSLAFLRVVLKHNLAPSKSTNLLKSLRDIRSEIQTCLRKLDTAFQHTWVLYTTITNRLMHLGSNVSLLSTSTTLTARIQLLSWLENTCGVSRQGEGAMTIEQVVSRDQVEPNTLNREEEEEVRAPGSHSMGFDELSLPSVKRPLRIKHPYSNQVVEAILILHEFAEGANYVEFSHILGILHSAIRTAVTAKDEQEEVTTDIFYKFRCYLESRSQIWISRMTAARSEDMRNAIQTRSLLARGGEILKQPLLRRRGHHFRIAELPIDVSMKIPYDATLPEIIWMLYCVLGNDTPVNPHFYPDTAFEENIEYVLPLGDPNPNVDSGRWTECVHVYGDNTHGRIKVFPENAAIAGPYRAVIRCMTQAKLTLFKDIRGKLLVATEVGDIFLCGRQIKCLRWKDHCLVMDRDVRSLRHITTRVQGAGNQPHFTEFILHATTCSSHPNQLVSPRTQAPPESTTAEFQTKYSHPVSGGLTNPENLALAEFIESLGLEDARFCHNQQVAHWIGVHWQETYNKMNSVLDKDEQSKDDCKSYKYPKYADEVNALNDWLFKLSWNSELETAHSIAKTDTIQDCIKGAHAWANSREKLLDVPKDEILEMYMEEMTKVEGELIEAADNDATAFFACLRARIEGHPMAIEENHLPSVVKTLLKETTTSIGTLGGIMAAESNAKRKQERQIFSIQFAIVLHGAMGIASDHSEKMGRYWKAHFRSRQVWAAAKLLAEHLNKNNIEYEGQVNWEATYNYFLEVISNLPWSYELDRILSHLDRVETIMERSGPGKR